MCTPITKKNHYNPCFWTAYWNKEYYEIAVKGGSHSNRARDQKIFSLNLYADTVIPTKTENIHYDKKLGIAKISPESMVRFCTKWHPEQLDEVSKHLHENNDDLLIDFEDTLTFLERTEAYASLTEVITSGNIESVEQKGFLSCLFILQAMRSYEMMRSMIIDSASLGMDKWEYFWLLQNAWGNPLILSRAVTPIAFSQWIIYKTEEHTFPLCDSPVMINKHSIMVVLSPRLLLEINLKVNCQEDKWIIKKGISTSKYNEFKKRTIRNTFKDIIFHNQSYLNDWKKSPEYKVRKKLLTQKNNEFLIHDAASHVIWLLSGCGKVSKDFEKQISPIFGL